MDTTRVDKPDASSTSRFENHPVIAWLLVTVFLCLATEVLLRVFTLEAVRFGKDFREVYRYHPRWYTDFEPGTTTTIRLSDVRPGYFLNFMVTVNESGFRWHDRMLDYPLPQAGDGNLIHAIGDSFTMGWGVNYESSYPALLSEKYAGSRTVLNLGLNGFGTIGATEKSLALMDRYRPQAVVYTFTENDYDDDVLATRHMGRPAVVHGLYDLLNFLRRNTYLASVPYGLRWWLYFRPGMSGEEPPRLTDENSAITPLDVPPVSDPAFGEASKRAITRYAAELQRRNIPLVVIAHGEGPAAADFTRYCLDNGIDARLVKIDASLMLRREGHLNRRGNQAFSDYVKALLDNRL